MVSDIFFIKLDIMATIDLWVQCEQGDGSITLHC